ncbi:MAG: class I SAM-dependent methyltransferase [Aphanocapsa lilacina HA4352-LM1]|jgi:tRNA G37 N-methylase Trm5|nr:class I SAM-dependent methyltransferase [Aphanocapsa lilacina HA4352-LM1]
MQLRSKVALLGAAAALAALGTASTVSLAQTAAPETGTQVKTEVRSPKRDPDVVYVPTPQEVVDQMLTVAQVGKDDVIYDLGSGDGRIVVTAAKQYGARGIGIDINPARIVEANENARKAGVTNRVRFLEQDLFETDLSEATVVTLYLLPDLNVKLRPRLFSQLKPGTRVVSHAFDMGSWKPDRVLKVKDSTVYYWVIPEKVPENLR